MKTCTDELEQDPRPEGYLPVSGVKGNTDLYRGYSDDRKFRIIYGVEDDLRAVIIVAIRRRNEGTYSNAPVKSLSNKVKEIAEELKVIIPLIRYLADEVGIEWASRLDDSQIRCLHIGIKAVKDRRKSPLVVAEKIKETIKVDESVKTIARDMKHLLQRGGSAFD
ncbi:MAG: type II toxin-antitoxin system RelE family toxin [Desulfomonilaceae bacterium]